MVRYEAVTSPRWFSAAHSSIICEVVFPHIGDGPVTFHASGDDTHEHGREIFEECRSGKYGPIAPFIPPSPRPATAEQASAECARRIRAVASSTTQMNLNAYVNVLNALPARSSAQIADLAAFVAGVQWIATMRATWESLVGTFTFADDASWPVCPPEAVALAARF